MTSVVWFRQDLRMADNPALAAAAKRGPVIPVYILENPPPAWAPGGASRWWLHHSLAGLRRQLEQLYVFRGTPRDILPALAAKSKATAIYWNRCYEPHIAGLDAKLTAQLQGGQTELRRLRGNLLHEPEDIATGAGGPFKVFTPFWRACLAIPVAKPLPSPKCEIATCAMKDDGLEALNLLPAKPNWAAGWEKLWSPGEEGAHARFDGFIDGQLQRYHEARDRADLDGTSLMSPHLHFGEISPRQMWARLAVASEGPGKRNGTEKFKSELGWREFSYHLLHHFPALPEKNWRPEFDAYPWQDAPDLLEAWQRGQTGYPLVDAAMRQLWQTGWMHNRMRMVAASFLVKHLRIDWRQGERWFWDTLVDADLANNAASWQWVAGSGADAAPYFRVFNPVTQGKKFDPTGDHVRRWCPQLARLPDELIHEPFNASAEDLAKAGVVLGDTYPKPIMEHRAAREAALAGYARVRAGGSVSS